MDRLTQSMKRVHIAAIMGIGLLAGGQLPAVQVTPRHVQMRRRLLRQGRLRNARRGDRVAALAQQAA